MRAGYGRGRIAALAAGAVLAAAATALAGLQLVDWTSGTVQRIERRSFAADIERISVRTGSGEIRIAGAPGGAVTVEGRLSGSVAVPRLSAVVRDGVLFVDTTCGFALWSCQGSLDLRVPPNIPVSARTGSGAITATDLPAAATLHTGSGSVRVDGAGATLALSTGSGDLRARRVTAGQVRASTGSGNVRVELDRVPEEVAVRTGSGNAEIVLPPGGTPYATDIHTGSGDSRISVPTDPAAARHLRVSTGSGDVVVSHPEPAGVG
ncbi:DUF4097 family beta strand repeat-containing protein [Parafrankia elaeagni]|uniref:DUF4097 family beta strand repeat-containing protein n=1 Tax=Parafrankia elaeagni TaxID=222534 RepID=UPI00037BC047|nr:DUF4097 family beta strand repeat-containing protein [Parafrankia elaeagni]